jgi:hypothetical protein
MGMDAFKRHPSESSQAVAVETELSSHCANCHTDQVAAAGDFLPIAVLISLGGNGCLVEFACTPFGCLGTEPLKPCRSRMSAKRTPILSAFILHYLRARMVLCRCAY